MISTRVCRILKFLSWKYAEGDFPDFKSKKIRVNLNLPIKAEVKAESADVLKAVDEDRKYVIQATIVRYVPVSIFLALLY